MEIEHIILNNLLPCPFCGSAPELIRISKAPDRYYCECPHCGIQQGYSYDYEDAVDKWNERIKD